MSVKTAILEKCSKMGVVEENDTISNLGLYMKLQKIEAIQNEILAKLDEHDESITKLKGGAK